LQQGYSVRPTLSTLEQLSSSHIDLWFITPTQISDLLFNYLKTLLTKKEKDKLAHYKNSKAQHTALITRAICRLVLSQYTNTTPSDLSFIKNQHGKPELTNNSNKIRFNLSHNNDLIIIAICAKDDIGCDIENPLRKVNIEPLTRRYFSEQEHLEICTLTPKIQQQRFFEMWTLKEAFVKATGIGISLGLDTFYFDKDVVSKEINVQFNESYPLNKSHIWQLYQQELEQQLLAVCRSSKLKQSINFLDASQLTTSMLED